MRHGLLGVSVFVAICLGISARGFAAEPASRPKAQTSTAALQPIRLQILLLELSIGKLRAEGKALSLPVAKDGEIKSSAADRLLLGADGLNWNIVDADSPTLKSLEDYVAKGYARTLANPTLMAIPGRPAQLSCGGEIPVLVPQGAGTVAIEWKKYGSSIDIVPIASGDALRLELRVRQSELDPAHGVALDGAKVPGIRVLWDLETGANLKPGEVLVLGSPSRDVIGEAAAAAPDKAQNPAPSAVVAHELMQTLILVRPQLPK